MSTHVAHHFDDAVQQLHDGAGCSLLANSLPTMAETMRKTDSHTVLGSQNAARLTCIPMSTKKIGAKIRSNGRTKSVIRCPRLGRYISRRRLVNFDFSPSIAVLIRPSFISAIRSAKGKTRGSCVTTMTARSSAVANCLSNSIRRQGRSQCRTGFQPAWTE